MEIVPFSKWIPGTPQILVVAGPCSAESEQQVLDTAMALSRSGGVSIFRAGVWKGRTSPQSFEGVGEKALPWLHNVKKLTGMLVATEVATGFHVEAALKAQIDVLWLGARTVGNPFSVSEITSALQGVDIPVLVKNPVSPDIGLWIGAIERVMRSGTRKIVAVHRGFSTFEKGPFRNPPLWRIPLELRRRMPGLPVICDVSHICGNREMIPSTMKLALDYAMEGLMVEVHVNPSQALSDRDQQLEPESFGRLLKQLSLKRRDHIEGPSQSDLDEIRSRIDLVDHEMLFLLKRRQDLVEEIASVKNKLGLTPLQFQRMEKLLEERAVYAENLGLSARYVEELFGLIHAESLSRQTQKVPGGN
jgi:chorismate mutase